MARIINGTEKDLGDSVSLWLVSFAQLYVTLTRIRVSFVFVQAAQQKGLEALSNLANSLAQAYLNSEFCVGFRVLLRAISSLPSPSARVQTSPPPSNSMTPSRAWRVS